jgi:hypothetical protein
VRNYSRITILKFREEQVPGEMMIKLKAGKRSSSLLHAQQMYREASAMNTANLQQKQRVETLRPLLLLPSTAVRCTAYGGIIREGVRVGLQR